MASKGEILSGTELFSIKDDPDNYLIDGLVWEHQNIILLAKEKAGKSLLSLQMACALSCGESLFGEYEIPEPMQVLYIQTESTRHETIQRLRAMTGGTNGVSWNPDNFYLMHTTSLSLDKDDGLKWLINKIDEYDIRPKVIFIDPLYMSMEGSLSDDMAARKASRNIRIISEYFDCTNIVNHHEHRPKMNKESKYINEGDNAVMGSFVWKAFPNHIIRLAAMTDKTRVLSCTTQRSSRVVENMKLSLESPLPLKYSIIGSADHPNYVNMVESWIKKHGPKCAQEIHEEVGISLSAVKKSLSYLSKHNVNKIVRLNPGSRPTYYKAVESATVEKVEISE